MTEMMPVNSIRLPGRRTGVGDLEALAKSIDDIGFIQAPTVTAGGDVLLGERRVLAARLLGRAEIPVFVAKTLDEILDRARHEFDDDTEMYPMKLSELTRMCMDLEKFNEPYAFALRAQRLRVARLKDRGPLPPSDLTSPVTRIAAAVDWSASNYGRAKHVVRALQAEDPKIRAAAKRAIKMMDETGQVHRAYDMVRELTRIRDERVSVISAQTDGAIRGSKAQKAAFVASIPVLLGTTEGLERIKDIDEHITSVEAAQWVDGLAEARRRIERSITRLRRHIAKEETT